MRTEILILQSYIIEELQAELLDCFVLVRTAYKEVHQRDWFAAKIYRETDQGLNLPI